MNYAIILSGGIGTRMRTDGFPKQYLQVEGKTILQYTLETLAECSIIDVIVIVMAEEWKKKIGKNIVESVGKKILFALPGSSRQESIFHGLQACVANKEIDVNDKVSVDNYKEELKKLQHEINIAKKKVEDGNIESLRESLDKMNDIKLEGHRKFR